MNRWLPIWSQATGLLSLRGRKCSGRSGSGRAFIRLLSGAILSSRAIFASAYIICYNVNIMSKRQVLMIIGVLVAIVPFLGFPLGFQKFWAVFCGIVVALIAYSFAPKVKPVKSADVPFSEHKSAPVTTEQKTAPTSSTASTITNQNPPEQK